MHDWSLISINIDWLESKLIVSFKNNQSENSYLICEKFIAFNISKKDEWGSSISINGILDFKKLGNGNFHIKFEIQSGDLCEIEAEKITLPEGAFH